MHSRSHEQTLGLPLWPFVGIGVAPATRAFEPGRGGLDLAATTAAREGGHYAGAFAGMTTGPREDGGHAKAIPAGTPTTRDGAHEVPSTSGRISAVASAPSSRRVLTAASDGGSSSSPSTVVPSLPVPCSTYLTPPEG